jgi:hypothetical protein
MEFHFPHCALIHRSAWNRYSANFAYHDFSEVRGSNLPRSGMALADRGGAMRVTSGRRPLARTGMRYQGSWAYAGWRRKES